MRSHNPDVACLMLTSFSDDEALFDAVMAGAAGYLLKQVRENDLVAAVRTVAAGGSLLEPAAIQNVLNRVRSGNEDDQRLGVADRAGAEDLRSHRGGHDQPPDRRRDLPRGEDGQELRVVGADEARDGAPHGGGGLRRPRGRAQQAHPLTTPG